jgi:hypothetical protein
VLACCAWGKFAFQGTDEQYINAAKAIERKKATMAKHMEQCAKAKAKYEALVAPA